MTIDYRDELFASYDRRSAALDPDARSKVDWFGAYAREAYLRHLPSAADRPAVLDVGCNRGFLLAALADLGYGDLHGVELSSAEAEHARRLVPGAHVHTADAASYLAERPASFDVIIIKAVLEHVAKRDTLPLLRALRDGLRPGGCVVVDVPNMDWLFASHERYMDFTHETGYTKESLAQVLGQVFRSADVRPVDWVPASRLGALRTRLARRVLGTLLTWAHPEGGTNPVWARSLVAVAR